MLLAAHAGTRRALCTLAGTWEQTQTKIRRALGEMMVGPWVATRLGILLIVLQYPESPFGPKISNALSVRLKLKTSKVSKQWFIL